MCFVAFIDVCESDRITTGMTNFRNYSDYFLGSKITHRNETAFMPVRNEVLHSELSKK